MLDTLASVGMPNNVPLPLWLSTKVTPVGSGPVCVIEGVGYPAAATVNEPAAPTGNVALLRLENEGDWVTVRVKL